MIADIPDELILQGLEILRSAFGPQRCVAEMYDYNSRGRFRIFDAEDRPLLRMDKVEKFVLADRRHLAQTIEAARRRLERNGVALNPWTMPE